MPKISVIVPVYNVEKYLNRCVDSILAQTFTDFEVILVDDGSSDNSGKICDEYAAKDSRIKVFHKANGGVSAARNLGLGNARGEYIMFCDSDDAVQPDWMTVLYDAIEENPDSLVNCTYKEIKNGNPVECGFNDIPLKCHLAKTEYYKYCKYQLAAYLWIRIFRNDIIKEHNLLFDEAVSYGEDDLFIIDYLNYCKDFYCVQIPSYLWIGDNNVNSLSQTFDPHHYDVLKQLYDSRCLLVNDKDKQAFYDEFFYRFFTSLKCVFDAGNHESKKEKIKYCNYILNDNSFRETLKYVSEAVCSKKLKLILNLRNYKILDRLILHYL